jgi:hypothetical protein
MTVAFSTRPWQGVGHGRIEAADRLRPAEDQQHPLPCRHLQMDTGSFPVDLARIADGRARHEARRVAGGRGEGLACRLVGDRDHVGQPGRQPDGLAWDHVAVPQDDRDAQRRRRHEHRNGHVAAGREDRGGPLPGEDGGACGTDAARRTGSSTVCTFRSTVRSERSISRCSGMPAGGTSSLEAAPATIQLSSAAAVAGLSLAE